MLWTWSFDLSSVLASPIRRSLQYALRTLHSLRLIDVEAHGPRTRVTVVQICSPSHHSMSTYIAHAGRQCRVANDNDFD